MSRKKVDKRICNLIKRSVFARHRSMFFILGKNCRDQIVLLHHLLVKHRESRNMNKLVSLWCFRKELGFNLFHNKKLKKMKKNYAENYFLTQEDTFEHFLLASNIQACHYSETDTILGQTFGLLIIQDFEALTPNILARILECVEGGGMIIYLLPKISSVEDIFTLHLDAHSRYVTESHASVTPLFNKRFVLSLLSCKNCLVLDDSLKIKLLPHNFDSSDSMVEAQPIYNRIEKSELDNSSLDNFCRISALCSSSDQSAALEKLYESLKNKNVFSVVSLTAGRGRGKSAVLGLAACLALNMHLSNIYLTSPHLENIQTLFTFLIKGLKSLNYVENEDFTVSYSGSKPINFIVSVKVCREHKQSVSYISPLDFQKLGNAELILIDEAAAIPLEIVKKWIGPYIIYMASTINGYEGTGRSLSLKLINQLRNQRSSQLINHSQKIVDVKGHTLHEITLNEAIRYADGDNIESWLNTLLCLDATVDNLMGCLHPEPENCQLYYVNRNALFSYNKYAEMFLQQIVSLFVTSHYKNSPNDLLMMADAPAHHIFCLLPPLEKNFNTLPKVLCVIQVALEGKISAENYNYEQAHGRRASGDLIPWTISQQFQEQSFTFLSGARVVRIATHPHCQSMGYGHRALELLCRFYDGSSVQSDDDPNHISKKDGDVKAQDSTLPLLFKFNEVSHEVLDYIGVSYGLTPELLKFWKRSGFVPLYLRQTKSDVTGEHSCVMLKVLRQCQNNNWLSNYFADFTSKFVSLLPIAFNSLKGSFALSILYCKNLRPIKGLSSYELQWFICPRQLKRLDAYCNNTSDYHLVSDLLPGVTKLYFSGFLNGYFLSSVQEVILLCMGLQNKSVEVISNELNMEVQQVMGCFRKSLKKIVNYLNLLFQKGENGAKGNKEP